MKIVYTYVCGDILHEGHLKPRPTVPFNERIRLIKSLKFVDCAVAQDDYSPLNNIKTIQPDIHVESSSHIGNPYLEELKNVFKGKIVMMPYYPLQSSTSIKKKIKVTAFGEKTRSRIIDFDEFRKVAEENNDYL